MVKKEQKNNQGYKQVALAILAHEYSYQRRKIRGIIDYYQEHSAWNILRNDQCQPFVALQDLKGQEVDGIIGEIYDEGDAAIVQDLDAPFINTSSSTIAPNVPSVCVDNIEIGKMAAKHLLQLELDRFAFIGPTELCHASLRRQGFVKEIEFSGGKCEVIDLIGLSVRPDDFSAESVTPDDLKEAVASLNRPVGVMASSDRVGFAVLEACRQLGYSSPEDITLISVDNDEIYCHLAFCSMTSIEPNAREVGFQAATMLDRLMNGESLEEGSLHVPPRGIISRDSTDQLRSQYPEVAKALRFIRNHASKYIDVTDVLNVVPASRRWLEVKFKEDVGHGIYQEILRVHVERACELVNSTDWPISKIADQSGFTSTERLDFAFRRVIGISFGEYQNQNQNQ